MKHNIDATKYYDHVIITKLPPKFVKWLVIEWSMGQRGLPFTSTQLFNYIKLFCSIESFRQGKDVNIENVAFSHLFSPM